MSLKPVQKRILDDMFYERRFLTTREVAELTGYSWQTVETHLKILSGKKFVKKKIERTKGTNKTRHLWMFNYDYYRKLKEEKSTEEQ